MNVTIENVAPCRKRVRVDVEAQKVDSTFEEVTSSFQREVKLPGFRPGKVPRHMVLQHYSKAVEEEVRRKLCNDSWNTAVREHKLHVVGNPEVKEVQLAKGQQFAFTAEVETAPEFEVPEYKGIPVKKENRSVTDADVERAVNVLREREAQFNDVERPLQQGDIAVVNYQGTSEGKPLLEIAPTARGLTTQANFWIEIKEGNFIPGFTEQLLGAAKGEKRTVSVTFPEGFVAAELAGKPGSFEVEIVQVKERKLPEVDEAFAKRWGVENVEALQAGVRQDLEKELERNISRNVRTQLTQGLLSRVKVDLPDKMLGAETRNMVYNVVSQNQNRGIDPKMIEEKKHEIFTYADRTAREKLTLAFIIGKIAEKENITVSQEEVASYVYHIAQERDERPEKVAKDLRKNNGFTQLHEEILFAKVVDFLEKYAAVEYVQGEENPQAS